MELIDTDAVRLPEGFFEKVDNVPKFYDWLNSLPTIDAVPVVRCKDCRWKLWTQCTRFEYLPVTDEDYCSKAERRTDA